MALIKCAECGKEFSDKANACPNCACPIEKKQKNIKDFKELTNEEKQEIIYEMRKNHAYPFSMYVGYFFIIIELLWAFISIYTVDIFYVLLIGCSFMALGIFFLLQGNKEIVNYYDKHMKKGK